MKPWTVFLFLALVAAAPPEALAKKILIIGDSHSCGTFGQQLVKKLSDSNEVTLYCKIGSSPQNWLGKETGRFPCQTCTGGACAKGPQKASGCEIGSLLSKGQYDEVVAAFGTNSISGRSSAAGSAYSDLAKAIKQKAKSCKWVGPPQFANKRSNMQRNLAPFYENLDAALGDACRIIDSRQATSRGDRDKSIERDGYHRTPSGGRSWADKIYKQIDDGGKYIAPDAPITNGPVPAQA